MFEISTNIVSTIFGYGYDVFADFITAFWKPAGILLGITAVSLILKAVIDKIQDEVFSEVEIQENLLHNVGYEKILSRKNEDLNLLERFARNTSQVHETSPLFKNKQKEERDKRYQKYVDYGKSEDKKREERYKMYEKSKYNVPENDRGNWVKSTEK